MVTAPGIGCQAWSVADRYSRPTVWPVTVTCAVPRSSTPMTPGTTSVAPPLVTVAVWVRTWPGRVSARSTTTSTPSVGTSVGGAIVRAGRVQPDALTLRFWAAMSIRLARIPQ